MQVLVFGKTKTVMERALVALTEAKISAVGTLTLTSAKERIATDGIDLVVIGGGVPDTERAAVKAFASRSGVSKTIEVFGPGLLVNAVRSALE